MATLNLKKVLPALVLAFGATSAQAVTIDNSQSFQSIRGFGASSAWHGSYTTAQLDALFRADTGIGLTLLRHRIPPDNNFNSGISILQGARDRGATIWATSWSPPGQWKNNGSPNGPGTGGCNQNNLAFLLPQNYQNFANYLASYVTTLRDTYNVDLFALSPQNEPNWCPDYEASWMDGEDFRVFVRDNLGPTFQAQGLSTRIIIPEPINGGALASLANPCLNDVNCRNRLFAVATHLYGAAPSAFPAAAANGKEYWETEISTFEAYDPSMTHGLTTAGWIHGSMAANMNAFHYWWAVSNANNEGLIHPSQGNPKRYYVMGNYSKFVRPGSVRIGASGASSGVQVTAYRNPAANQMVIVAVNNNSGASGQTFNLSGLSVGSVTPWITDDSRSLAAQGAVSVSGNAFSYSLPGRSVTTFVGAIGGPLPTPTFTPVPSNTWRVNAGGPAFTDGAGNAWSADAGFTGGEVSSVTTAIAGTTDDTLYQSERWGNSTYTFSVPAGSYQVTLKFAEIYMGITGAGQRVFNASINGSTVISNLDIFGQVGANTATDRVFSNIAPSGGQIVVNIGPSSVENAKVSAIQIIPQPAPPTSTATQTPLPTNTPQPTSTPTPSSVWRVNAGGAAFTDAAGNAWIADGNFTGGQVSTVTSAIAGTTDDTLYQSERYGNSTYTFNVPAGSYQVTLKMAEIYTGITGAGQRVFNAAINGATVLSNLDIFAEVGANTVDDKVFNNIAPSGGQIVVNIGPSSVENAKVSAIQIIPQPAPPTSTPVPPTNTPVPPTNTPVPPTNTPVPSTATFTHTPTTTGTATPAVTPDSPTATPVSAGSVVRINAGGPAYTDGSGNLWSADAGFTGGSVFTVTSAIAGTTDDTLYQSERWGNSTYTLAVNPGSYQVTLKFAEIYSGITAAGQRVFNVSINGATVLSNLDIFGQVGANTATDGVFNNIQPSGGQIVVNIGPSSADNAKVSAIQIIPQPAVATLTPTPADTPVPGSVVRINAGGAAFTDGAGNPWSADQGFTGGTARTITNAINATTDDPLYQSERWGNSTYTLAVNPGSYQVTLKMADIYDGITGAGQRVFDVSINGSLVLTNLDIFAEVGGFTADDKVFNNISPVNGQITLQFGPASANNATIGAIQVIPQPAGGGQGALANLSGDGNGLERFNTVDKLLFVAPNPAQDQARAFYGLTRNGNTMLSLVSLDGQLLQNMKLGFQRAGQHSVVLDLHGLATGIYLVVLRSDEGMGYVVRASFKLAVAK